MVEHWIGDDAEFGRQRLGAANPNVLRRFDLTAQELSLLLDGLNGFSHFWGALLDHNQTVVPMRESLPRARYVSYRLDLDRHLAQGVQQERLPGVVGADQQRLK